MARIHRDDGFQAKAFAILAEVVKRDCTTRMIAEATGRDISRIGQTLRSAEKAGLVRAVGRRGNAILWGFRPGSVKVQVAAIEKPFGAMVAAFVRSGDA